MFSGIIAYRGIVERVDALPEGGMRLRVRCGGVAVERPQPKDSVAINGVCLTATAVDGDSVGFDVVPETLERSTLGALMPGDEVNVEYALRVGDRMGGHFVYGHVDAAARVLSVTPEGQGTRMRIAVPPALRRFIREKGFISVDGVSVTIAATDGETFDVAVIPETLSRTTMGTRRAGSYVNLEVDPLARYAAV